MTWPDGYHSVRHLSSQNSCLPRLLPSEFSLWVGYQPLTTHEPAWADGTASWSAMTLPATRQALSWALRRSAAWPMPAKFFDLHATNKN